MRQFINIVTNLLVEAQFLRVPGEGPKPITVWMNPSYRDLLNLIHQFELRGILTPTNLFVWDAGLMTHSEMERELEEHHGFDMIPGVRSMIFMTPDTSTEGFDLQRGQTRNDWPNDRAKVVNDIKFVLLSADEEPRHYPCLLRALGEKEPVMEGRSVEVDSRLGTSIKVWIDPVVKETIAMAHVHPLRALSTPDHFFEWDAGQMTHHEMARFLQNEHGFSMDGVRALVITKPRGWREAFGDDSYTDWSPDITGAQLWIAANGTENDGTYQRATTARALGLN